jgi:hypothetical protein
MHRQIHSTFGEAAPCGANGAARIILTPITLLKDTKKQGTTFSICFGVVAA